MNKESIINKDIHSENQLILFLKNKKVHKSLINEIIDGIRKNAMSMRLTPHLVKLINWDKLKSDPIRKQFLPLYSEFFPNHPMLKLDSLNEKKAEKVPGLIHRYPNKLLFLVGKTCPAYCAFCTRSYMVGPNTNIVQKDKLNYPIKQRFEKLFTYLKQNKHVNDILLSGGDILSIKIEILDSLLDNLLKIDSLKTVRIATRGLFFSPEHFLPGTPFYNFLQKQIVSYKKKGRNLSIQSHFNHSAEITPITKKVVKELIGLGYIIRNQSVLLHGVNSSKDDLVSLIESLIEINITPYYIYQMDMVANTEHFRTSISETISLAKEISGVFTGFQTPKFIVDLPKGGGKKNVFSYEDYDPNLGCYSYSSEVINPQEKYFYFDPLRVLNSVQKKNLKNLLNERN